MVTTIKTWEDIKQFCTEYDKLRESDNFWEKLLNTVDFNSDDLKHFTFEIHGDKFKSSITAGYAQSIIDFQDRFFKIIKSLETGTISSRKVANTAQLFFTVSEGCTNTKSGDLYQYIPESIKEYGKLTKTGQLILGFIVISCFIAWGVNNYFEKNFEYLEKIELAQIASQDRESERENLQKILASDSFKNTVKYAHESSTEVRASFIKNTPVNEVESIKFPTETLTKSQIIDEQKTNPIEKRSEIKTLDFKVLNLSGSFSKQKLKARAQLVSDPSIVINLSSELLDEEDDSALSENDDEHLLQESDIDILWDAQKHNKIVSIMGNFFYDQENKLIKGAMWSISRKEDK